MTLQHSNPGLRLSSGKGVRSTVRQRQRFQRVGGAGPGALRPLAAGARSRLALAAALVVATLLSPGASGACAGCCDDDPPTVVVPLAAGIAPVHAAAAHRCCHATAGDASAVAGSCCSDRRPETDGCRTPADRSEPCDCRSAPRDEAAAVPARALSDDLRGDAAGTDPVFTATAVDVGRMSAAFDGQVLPTHARPLRVLFGVWRN